MISFQEYIKYMIWVGPICPTLEKLQNNLTFLVSFKPFCQLKQDIQLPIKEVSATETVHHELLCSINALLQDMNKKFELTFGAMLQ